MKLNEMERVNLPNFVLALLVGIVCLLIAVRAIPHGDPTGFIIFLIFGVMNIIIAYNFRSVIK